MSIAYEEIILISVEQIFCVLYYIFISRIFDIESWAWWRGGADIETVPSEFYKEFEQVTPFWHNRWTVR